MFLRTVEGRHPNPNGRWTQSLHLISITSACHAVLFVFFLSHLLEGLSLMACYDLNGELNIYFVILEVVVHCK